MHRNPENIAEIIIDSYNQGVRAINLVNDDALIEGFDIALENGCKMDVIATIGKSEVDYMYPNYDVAKEVDWQEDIDLFLKYNAQLMIIDEFVFDSNDWKLNTEILNEINNTDSLAGISTSFPFKTNKLLGENIDLDLFDFYMVPINKLAYMMDTQSLLSNEKEELKNDLLKLNKKIIASRVLAAGILTPEEAFKFIKDFEIIDLITIGVANKKEVEMDFQLLFNL